jgi:hypothetical protein
MNFVQNKVMNTLLWAGQIVLALAFGYSGFCKSLYSEAILVDKKGQTGVAGLPLAVIRTIGITEVLGMVGIIVPWWAGIAPVLTPITAVCFAFVMVLAAPIHYKRREPKNVAVNIGFFVLAIFTACGRFAGWA